MRRWIRTNEYSSVKDAEAECFRYLSQGNLARVTKNGKVWGVTVLRYSWEYFQELAFMKRVEGFTSVNIESEDTLTLVYTVEKDGTFTHHLRDGSGRQSDPINDKDI